jgi:predicted nuclease of restriction endonuclease-like (RecB) superfamily
VVKEDPRMAKKRGPKKKAGQGQAKETDLVLKGYEKFLGELKERIRSAQLKAAVSFNRELVLLYWQIGRDILTRQKEHGWGAKVIDQLAGDLRREFPGIEGFSPRNLKYMRVFAQAWPDEPIVQQLVGFYP